ncbi:MAG TPA: hypothetical protein VH370_12885 [Humisphaera sp.]|jgi:hypothetical protein|nr:hypothetical protein [Humisphaera sp.]
MDTTTLLLGIVFGAVGLGYVAYAKNVGQPLPAIMGLGLMIVPYFISNVLLLTIVCVAMMAIPFLLRG